MRRGLIVLMVAMACVIFTAGLALADQQQVEVNGKVYTFVTDANGVSKITDENGNDIPDPNQWMSDNSVQLTLGEGGQILGVTGGTMVGGGGGGQPGGGGAVVGAAMQRFNNLGGSNNFGSNQGSTGGESGTTN